MPRMPLQKKPRKSAQQISKEQTQKSFHAPDMLLFGLIISLTLFGLLMIADVSSYEGFHTFGDKYYFAKQQFIGIILGFIAGTIAYKLNIKAFYKLSAIILAGALLLLIAVLIPGVGVHALGARRWINLSHLIPFMRSFTLQPAEIVKPALIIYLAAWFTKTRDNLSPRSLLTVGGIALVVLILVMLEPDLGTAMIIVSTIVALYFISGAPIYQFLVLLPIGAFGLIALVLLEPYRFQRLTTFLNPQIDPQGSSYHISQVLLTLGSGGLFGVGLGNSSQKYGYLPEANSDSIFAVIAGELGFVGALVVVCVFVLLLWRSFTIARRIPDHYGQLLAIGLTVWLGFQTLINMGSMVALFPLTGVPLPFISFGSSSLVTVLFAAGLLLNLSRYTKR